MIYLIHTPQNMILVINVSTDVIHVPFMQTVLYKIYKNLFLKMTNLVSQALQSMRDKK